VLAAAWSLRGRRADDADFLPSVLECAVPVGDGDADGDGDGLGDGLTADGLGHAVDTAGDAPGAEMFPCDPWLFSDAVAAVGRVAVAPPTAQASKPSTPRPAASANSLRRQ
jgi:hypothetical protein